MILKKDKVKLTGPRMLDVSVGAARSSPVRAVGAKVVNVDQAGATLEVTCSCGNVIHIRCDYADAQAPGQANSATPQTVGAGAAG